MSAPRIVRTLSADVVEMVAEGFDFTGCSSQSASHCNCESWTPVECSLCDQEIVDGQMIQTISFPSNPHFDQHSHDQDWETTTWHTECPEPETEAPDGRE